MRISDWSSDVCSSDLLGQRIGKAVAKVQARFVAALAEIEKRLSRQFAMIERHRFDRDAGAAKEGFGLAHPFGTELAFDDHRQLDIAGDADAAGIGIMDGLCEGRRFGFAIEDRDQGRGVRSEEHTPELQSLMRISYAVLRLAKK